MWNSARGIGAIKISTETPTGQLSDKPLCCTSSPLFTNIHKCFAEKAVFQEQHEKTDTEVRRTEDS